MKANVSDKHATANTTPAIKTLHSQNSKKAPYSKVPVLHKVSLDWNPKYIKISVDGVQMQYLDEASGWTINAASRLLYINRVTNTNVKDTRDSNMWIKSVSFEPYL